MKIMKILNYNLLFLCYNYFGDIMKKYLMLLVLLFIVTGCVNEEKEVVEEPKPEPTTIPVPVYTDDNPIKVGLYIKGKLISEYTTSYANDKDIVSMDVYFTNESDVGSSNTKYNFKKYYNNYENIDKYKIGFYVSFETGDKHNEKVILDPDVEFALAPWIYIYLYDDVHQADGAWYSHVTKNDYNDDTIFSSIKLYMAEKCDEVTSDITVSVFTYDDMDDFDSDGYYRGNSIHTAIIKNG